MAILPNAIHTNPNLSAAAVGLGAAGISHFVMETDPLVTGIVGVGSGLLARGLIHMDTTSHKVALGQSEVVVTELGDSGRLAIAGILDVKDLERLGFIPGGTDPIAFAKAMSGK